MLALAEGDDVEIAHLGLKIAQMRVGVAHQLLVDRDGRADLALLFEALGLPHSGGQPAHLLAVVPVYQFELGEGCLEILDSFRGFLREGLAELVIRDALLQASRRAASE